MSPKDLLTGGSKRMKHESNVVLGKPYGDALSPLEVVPVTISFFRFGCARVAVEWLDANSTLNHATFDAERLTAHESRHGVYETEIVLGEMYQDMQSGVEGIAEIVTFGYHGCERVTLEWTKDGEPREATFDAPRLTRMGEPEPVKTERTGGPDRSLSHVRTGPVGR